MAKRDYKAEYALRKARAQNLGTSIKAATGHDSEAYSEAITKRLQNATGYKETQGALRVVRALNRSVKDPDLKEAIRLASRFSKENLLGMNKSPTKAEKEAVRRVRIMAQSDMLGDDLPRDELVAALMDEADLVMEEDPYPED